MTISLNRLTLPLLVAALSGLAGAQNIQVASAVPDSASQGTIGLTVAVYGKGFKPGAVSRWFVTGTTNPGGVTVHSTTYISSTELRALITVAEDAEVALFDIEVQNSDGRKGMGVEKFSVTLKGVAATCVPQTPNPKFTFVTTLNRNPVLSNGGYGLAARMRPMVLNGNTVLVAAVGSNGTSGRVEVFVLNASTGQPLNLDGSPFASSGPPPRVILPISFGTRDMDIGDVDGNGVPDIAVSSESGAQQAVVFNGQVSGGFLAYSSPALLQHVPLTGDSTRYRYGTAVAMGDLDGDARDEVSVGAIGGGTGKNLFLGKVFIYRYDSLAGGFTHLGTVPSPLPNSKKDESFGASIAVGDVAGDSRPDLIVGAPLSTVGGRSEAGRALVFTNPLGAPSQYIAYGGTVNSQQLGFQVSAGNVKGISSPRDLIVSTWWTSSQTKTFVYPGLVSQFTIPEALDPAPGWEAGWTTNKMGVGDIDGDGLEDVVVGAPNGGPQGCNSPGAVHAFLTGSGSIVRELLQVPVADEDFGGFGWSVATANGYRVLIVGENGRNINGSPAGQVYIYLVN